MIKKDKYSLDFKLATVKEVVEGNNSIRGVARENQLHHCILARWVSFYRIYGISGLQLPAMRYDEAFKLKAIQTLRQEHLSLSATCLRFKIPSVGMLANWLKKYESRGIEALFKETRRKPKLMTMSDNTRKKPSGSKTKEQELEEENKYLRTENAYLKKLYALIQKEEAEKKKKR